MRKCDKEIIDGKSREEWLKLILNWIHNEKDRNMFIRWALDGISLEDVAEEFELSTNHCQERVEKAKKQLFKHVNIV